MQYQNIFSPQRNMVDSRIVHRNLTTYSDPFHPDLFFSAAAVKLPKHRLTDFLRDRWTTAKLKNVRVRGCISSKKSPSRTRMSTSQPAKSPHLSPPPYIKTSIKILEETKCTDSVTSDKVSSYLELN